MTKLLAICVQPCISFSVKYVPCILNTDDQWRIISECHKGVANSVEARAMSGHFGRDKTVQSLCSKLFFPNIKEKVSQFFNSCESCQCVKAGNKFDKGGEKLKSVPVPYQTMNQLGIDLITNLLKTPEGYNTIVIAVDYTSKWVESRALKGKFAEGVAEFMYDLVCHFGASKIHISDQGREFVNQVCVIHVCTVI